MNDANTTSPFREGAIGNSGGWTEERLRMIPSYKMQIVEGILNEMFLSEICMTLDVTQATVRKWRREDKEFDEAYTDAEASVTDTLEKEAIRRARNGVLEPVVSKGQLVMVKDAETGDLKPLQMRRYSDSLLQFLLKGRRKEVYGDKREIEATVGVDVAGSKAALEAKFAALGVTA